MFPVLKRTQEKSQKYLNPLPIQQDSIHSDPPSNLGAVGIFSGSPSILILTGKLRQVFCEGLTVVFLVIRVVVVIVGFPVDEFVA